MLVSLILVLPLIHLWLDLDYFDSIEFWLSWVYGERFTCLICWRKGNWSRPLWSPSHFVKPKGNLCDGI